MINPQKRRKKWSVSPEKVVRKPCSITQADIAAVLEVLNGPSLSLGPKLPASQRVMLDYSV